jgi:hypothetical protein
MVQTDTSVKVGKKMVYYKQREEAGINYISDLIKNDKCVIPFESLVKGESIRQNGINGEG